MQTKALVISAFLVVYQVANCIALPPIPLMIPCITCVLRSNTNIVKYDHLRTCCPPNNPFRLFGYIVLGGSKLLVNSISLFTGNVFLVTGGCPNGGGPATPCCGVGTCNALCCDCPGGCRSIARYKHWDSNNQQIKIWHVQNYTLLLVETFQINFKHIWLLFIQKHDDKLGCWVSQRLNKFFQCPTDGHTCTDSARISNSGWCIPPSLKVHRMLGYLHFGC
jgi:hypothetical protein